MSSFIKRYSNYLTQKMLSYREMNYDFCRVKRGYVDRHCTAVNVEFVSLENKNLFLFHRFRNDGLLRTLDTVKVCMNELE